MNSEIPEHIRLTESKWFGLYEYKMDVYRDGRGGLIARVQFGLPFLKMRPFPRPIDEDHVKDMMERYDYVINPDKEEIKHE